MPETVFDSLLEAFASPTTPPVTVAQSNASGAVAVANAKGAVAYDASHPRATNGKFTTKSTSRRATKSSRRSTKSTAKSYTYKNATGQSGTVHTGARGSLVSSIQRQLGVPVSGTYGAHTKSAVERYQRQHGLLVDGIVGRQTLAALRGHTNPSTVKPGVISTPSVVLKAAKLKASAPVSVGGGVVVR